MAGFGFFKHVDGPAGRASNWWTLIGPGGGLWAGMSWVVSYLEPVAKHGWPMIVVAGVVLSSMFMMGVGGLALAWRNFRPLPANHLPATAVDQVETILPPRSAGSDSRDRILRDA